MRLKTLAAITPCWNFGFAAHGVSGQDQQGRMHQPREGKNTELSTSIGQFGEMAWRVAGAI